MRVSRLAAVAGESITAHRRALLNTVFLLLTGSGVAAFGIAPLAPDAADMPRRVIAQIIETPDVSAQTDALSELDLRLVRNDLTRLGDTVVSALKTRRPPPSSVPTPLRVDWSRAVAAGWCARIWTRRGDCNDSSPATRCTAARSPTATSIA
jgi:hypothetical protein